jgi:hypothetical protein
VAAPASGLAPVYAAALFLLRRSATPVDVLRRLERFCSGGKLNAAAVRPALAAAGAGRAHTLKLPQAAQVIGQTTRFAPLLFRAAGYAGWCILLDEVELIGRYTPLQRALAYAQLAVWLGLEGARGFPGIVAAYAVTDDFAVAVIDARQDQDRLPERLRLKGRLEEADLARAGMAHIERTVREHRLLTPTVADLATCQDKVRRLYSTAFGWPAPSLSPGERSSSRTMRQYIKGWITQWDLLRLEGSAVALVSGTIASNYAEDGGLWEPAALEDETE